MIAKEYLKSMTDPEQKEEYMTTVTPVKENGVSLFRFVCFSDSVL